MGTEKKEKKERGAEEKAESEFQRGNWQSFVVSAHIKDQISLFDDPHVGDQRGDKQPDQKPV